MNYFRKMFIMGVVLIVTTTMAFSLKAEYRFEKCDGSASLENYAGSGLDGNLSGDANISLGDGKITNALILSGDGMMSVEHSPELDLVENLTIAFWINPAEIKRQYLVTKGFGSGIDRKYASNAEFFLKMNDSGKLVYRHNFVSDSTVIAYSDNNLSEGEWTHVVFIRDSSLKTMRFYVNGVASSEYTYTTDPQSSNSEKLILGQCDSCVNPDNFFGKLDEIKIYNRALAQGEITILYNRENSGEYSTSGCHPSPLVVDDSADLPFAGTTNIDILANDRTNDSDTCSIDVSTVMIHSNIADSNLSDNNRTLVVAGEGTWSVENNGSISFVSESAFAGNPRDISYRVSDSCGNLSNEAIVSLTRVAPISTPSPTPTPSPTLTPIPTPTPTSSPISTVDIIPISTPATVEDENIILGDMVWYDVDKNGIQDSGEQGVENVTVVLFDSNGSVIERTTTDTSGIYQFIAPVGSYILGFSNLPANYNFTSQNMGSNDAKDSDVDSSGRTAELIIGNVENDLIYDAGIVSTVIDSNITVHSSIDDNITIPVEDCECDDYKSTIPSINIIGLVAIWLLVSLLGVLFLREKEFSFNTK